MTTERNNISVDLIRILAIFIIIMLHTASWYILEGTFLKTEGMIYSFLQDGIPLLWYAVGMSLFHKDNTIKNSVISTGKHIVLPALVYVFLSSMLAPWLAGKTAVIDCLSPANVNWRGIAGSIVKGSTSGLPMGGHLWFVFSYIKLMLWFPLLRYICADDKKANAVRRYLILLALLSELAADAQQFIKLPTGNISVFTILNSDLLYVMLGYELSLWVDTLRTKKLLVFCTGSAVFFAANLSRFVVTRWFHASGNAYETFMHIEHIVSVFSSMGLAAAIMMIEPGNNTVRKLISKLADYSFLMYLAHWAVFNRMASAGKRALIYDKMYGNALIKLTATVYYGLIVFAVTLAVAVAARAIYRFCKTLVLGRQA